jgi:hypothetical protein
MCFPPDQRCTVHGLPAISERRKLNDEAAEGHVEAATGEIRGVFR